MSNEMLEKLVSTSSIGGGPGGGYLSIEQADSFIDHIFDAAVLWKEAEKRKMNASYAEWPTVRVGARIVRKATEGTATHQNAGASFSKVSLQTTKLRLDWEVTTESLEDNIEGESLDNHLLRLFTHQLAQDLEELSIHGDTGSADPLLSSFDGWHKQALANGHVRTAGAGSTLNRTHFNQAIRAMPAKYMRDKNKVRFYASTAACHEYLYSLGDEGAYVDEVVAQNYNNYPGPQGAPGAVARPLGIALVEVPMFDTNFNATNAGTGSGPLDSTSFLELVQPSNRLVGIQREIRILKQYVHKKDTFEYTCFVRLGVGIQDWDAYVTVVDVPIDETLT